LEVVKTEPFFFCLAFHAVLVTVAIHSPLVLMLPVSLFLAAPFLESWLLVAFFSSEIFCGVPGGVGAEMLSCSFLLAIFVRVLVCIVSPMWDFAEILVVGES